MSVKYVDKSTCRRERVNIRHSHSSLYKNEIFQTPFRMKKKLRMTKARYKCSECDFRTTSMKRLEMHEEVHPKGRKMKCSKCTFETRIKSCMIYHAAIHSGGKMFRCSKCTYKTDCLDDFLLHEAKVFNCFRCDSKFHMMKDLLLHLETVHEQNGKIFACGSCPFTALTKKEVDAHRNNPTSKIKFDCHWPLEYASKGLNIAPAKEKLISPVYFKCTTCAAKFKSQGALSRHARQHRSEDYNDGNAVKTENGDSKPVKMFPCLICNHKMSSKETQGQHLNRKHFLSSRSTPCEFLCIKCSYSTDEKLLFIKHSKIHCKNFSKNTILTKETEIFKCSFCEFETEFEEMIRSHLSTHSDDDSDFDADYEAPFTSVDASSAATKSETDSMASTSAVSPTAQMAKKFQCSNCEFATNLEQRFHHHRSLHLRQKVSSFLLNTTSFELS